MNFYLKIIRTRETKSLDYENGLKGQALDTRNFYSGTLVKVSEITLLWVIYVRTENHENL